MKHIILSLLLLSPFIIVHAEEESFIGQLVSEKESIKAEVRNAELKREEYGDGLLAALIEMRIELLKINEALIDQRIHAAQSGAKPNFKVTVSLPKEERAASLAKEMQAIQTEIEAKERESAMYTGGLVKVMLDSNIASMGTNYAMLQTEYLKAKYGISWMPTVSNNTENSSFQASANTSQAAEKPSLNNAPRDNTLPKDQFIIPTVVGKRFQETDYSRNIYEEAIWLDLQWDTNNLPKATRAIKGSLVLCDLFGEPKMLIGWTINDPLEPGQLHEEKGVGFTYKQFRDSHKWIRTTEIEDLTAKFEVSEIIYADGSRVSLK